MQKYLERWRNSDCQAVLNLHTGDAHGPNHRVPFTRPSRLQQLGASREPIRAVQPTVSQVLSAGTSAREGHGRESDPRELQDSARRKRSGGIRVRHHPARRSSPRHEVASPRRDLRPRCPRRLSWTILQDGLDPQPLDLLRRRRHIPGHSSPSSAIRVHASLGKDRGVQTRAERRSGRARQYLSLSGARGEPSGPFCGKPRGFRFLLCREPGLSARDAASAFAWEVGPRGHSRRPRTDRDSRGGGSPEALPEK